MWGSRFDSLACSHPPPTIGTGAVADVPTQNTRPKNSAAETPLTEKKTLVVSSLPGWEARAPSFRYIRDADRQEVQITKCR